MRQRKRYLVLFTQAYPYHLAAEQTFLDVEIEHLAAVFEEVVIVPRFIGGGRQELPGGVGLDESLAEQRPGRLTQVALAAGLPLGSLTFCRSLFRRPSTCWQPRALRRLASGVMLARRTCRWLVDFFLRMGWDPGSAVIYTYWLDGLTLGAGMAKSRLRGLRLVSRTHGVDLYAERHRPAYIPLQRDALAHLDRLYPVSAHGQRYICERHPEITSRCEASYLGIRGRGVTVPRSTDGVFRIVSCSSIVGVKRLHLLAQAVGELARTRVATTVEWHHVGAGPLRPTVEAVIRTFPANARAILHGYVPNEEVFEIYGTIPLDVFVNVSASEGVPVAIMEAASCGLPVTATAVGGSAETLDGGNGILLPPHPESGDVVAVLSRFLDDPAAARAMGEASARLWREKFDADANYPRFAEAIATWPESGAGRLSGAGERPASE